MKNLSPPQLSLETNVSEKHINSIDRIEDYLYLGSYNAFNDTDLLFNQINIQFVLTLGTGMGQLKLPENVERLTIPILDHDEVNIISHFNTTFDFIDKAVSGQKGILVHCMAGVSRSCTVVCAYLMKKHNDTLDNSLEKIKSNRRIVCPNSGFMEQLRVYEQVKYKLDINLTPYRRFLISKMSSDLMNHGYSNNMILGEDPENIQVTKSNTMTGLPVQKVRCKKCRRALAYPDHLIDHEPGKGQTSFGFRKRNSHYKLEEACSSYFIEPMAWIPGLNSGEMEGKIDCPKCHIKLGSWSWKGTQCSCGKWVTPAFMLHRSKVDSITPRSLSFYS